MQETVSTLLQGKLKTQVKARYLFKTSWIFLQLKATYEILNILLYPSSKYLLQRLAFTSRHQNPYNLLKMLPSRLPSPHTASSQALSVKAYQRLSREERRGDSLLPRDPKRKSRV